MSAVSHTGCCSLWRSLFNLYLLSESKTLFSGLPWSQLHTITPGSFSVTHSPIGWAVKKGVPVVMMIEPATFPPEVCFSDMLATTAVERKEWRNVLRSNGSSHNGCWIKNWWQALKENVLHCIYCDIRVWSIFLYILTVISPLLPSLHYSLLFTFDYSVIFC